ncbi:MAG: energy-coupling factor ABC transporter permease [Candidatus Lokiarchaeota archaeon]|nr:energy-coupling factor ABC transporter permease [Candidatus Lokiarchaeota archaeon]
MHLPDGLLEPTTIVVLWIVTIGIIALGLYRITNSKIFSEEDSEKLIPYIGVIAAVIFAFQFVNYPIPGGTSGHLVGGTLVAVVLGPWSAVIVLFLVLIVQSFFGDGGFTVIGANAFNMGIVGGIFGLIIVKLVVQALNRTRLSKEIKITIGTAIGSYIAIVTASIICGIEISIAGVIPLEYAVSAMAIWHALIGIGEAVISALIVFYIYKTKPSLILTEKFLGVE